MELTNYLTNLCMIIAAQSINGFDYQGFNLCKKINHDTIKGR